MEHIKDFIKRILRVPKTNLKAQKPQKDLLVVCEHTASMKLPVFVDRRKCKQSEYCGDCSKGGHKIRIECRIPCKVSQTGEVVWIGCIDTKTGKYEDCKCYPPLEVDRRVTKECSYDDVCVKPIISEE